MKKLLCILNVTLFLSQITCAQESLPGCLANPEFENNPIKSVFFFTGNWRNGIQFYDHNPSDNRGLFTLHPSDARHLGWSENQSNRDFVVQTMIDAGVNVINMSYWGLPGTDNWAYWSPMQTSTASHDELFDAALGKEILIAPYIESFAKTNNHEGFTFADDFPGTQSNPSPLLILMIEDLVNHYLLNPANSQWPSKWAMVYDQDGIGRYLVSLIHVASNQESVTDRDFAEGYNRVAEVVFENTGIHVGFALDVLPPDTYAPGIFKATPSSTGSWLAQQSSVLAIQCFLPEIWTGMSDEHDLITWKKKYHRSWINTGIPFIHDLTPGYDAQVVFPSSPIYGNTQSWRDLQTQAVNEFGSKSMTFNAWNGYTEGMAGVPTVQYGDASYIWLCNQYGGSCSTTFNMMNTGYSNKKLEILPNPVVYHAKVCLKNGNEHFLSYELVNSKGIIVKAQKVIHNNNPINSVKLNFEDLSPGFYVFIAKTNQSTYAAKVLKLTPG